jgi:2-polyprenyl-3-methyl-5-hydroxy-6-metoxy-1,4-benzoquinol methylase/glycosyltransferase involved in cell wall biosynthesis
MPKANVSVCLIVRNEVASGLFEECLQSIRPHVAELVIVDTGSTDGTPEIAKKYADVFEVFTECNDPPTVDGPIADFALARNRSFDLATQPWVMWLDSDDVVAGGELLERLVATADANKGDREWCYLFPYEYVYDPNGRCVCLHYRERLVSKRDVMQWVNPVHEVMIPADDARLILVPCDDVVVKHQRQRSQKPQEGGRNLRILQKLVEVDGSTDARQFYYLGLEYANANNVDKAIEWLSKYVSVSGWDDEKTMAALKLSEIHYALGRTREGIVWAFRAVETRENWGEGYFALARGFYQLAVEGPSAGDVRRNWEKCAHFAKVGLDLPPTKTMLFINPNERQIDMHVCRAMALSQLGNARGALEHAEVAYKQIPGDPNLTYNRHVFQRIVAKEDASAALGRLVEAEGIDPAIATQINGVLEGGEGTVEGWARYERPASYPRGVEEHHFPVARATPHARAFGLPSSSDIDDLPVRMTDAQLEAATILIWKEYVLHDELIAAERFLADAPYRVKHSAGILRALERTRGMMAWMDDAAVEQKVNTPEDPTIENGVPLPHALTGAVQDRSEIALRTLRSGEKILDLGCFDGGLVNRWALRGLDVTGVDLCEGSIALARRKAEEFETGAKFICSHFGDLRKDEHGAFDVVASCDTYEHMRDAVRDMILPARRMLKPSGRMVVVTPHGSWMRGEFVKWAHPWRWADDEGRPWNTDLPHAHLVAPTPWSVAEHFRSDGWWVKDSYVVTSRPEIADVPGQGNVYTEARLLPPDCAGEPLDIVFACGDAWQAWNPKVYAEQGLGGSETMVVELAKRLALAGHRVRVYTSTGKYGEGIFDGVEYYQTQKLELAKRCDVLVVWRQANLLSLSIEAKVRWLWVHDVFAMNATHPHLLQADRVLALSDWHKGFLADHHNLSLEQIGRTRNGIDLGRFDNPFVEHIAAARNPKKVVYSSSPDRGLPVLLHVWPEIRKRVPDAELHVFYGFFNWQKMAEAVGGEQGQRQLEAIQTLTSRLRELEPHGVTMHGKVDQQTLAREFLSAGVWAYPTWFSETSCLTAMEAQAAGLRIVTSSIAALNETVGHDYGVLLDGDWLSPEYQAKFVDETVRALEAPEGEWLRTRAEIQDRAHRDFGLDALAEGWVASMWSEIERLKAQPLVPYQGRADFKREAA